MHNFPRCLHNNIIHGLEVQDYEIKFSDMLSKFLRRPGQIEPICPVQFAKMFTTSGVNNNKKSSIQDEEEDQDEQDISSS